MAPRSPGVDAGRTAVGYGLQLAFPDAAAWKDQAARVRKVAHPWLIQNNTPFSSDIDLIVSDNAASGGTCFGDSGGPNFVGSSTVIAGVNSFVYNSQCAGFSAVYRIDKADDVNWLATFFD
ncbi:MAG TPA: trypsin-like serine protease [Candidatus Limnocylindrales bacterium]|nr:trypsin-like serine protease [Candidatus Limnocylindrales bacterium]